MQLVDSGFGEGTDPTSHTAGQGARGAHGPLCKMSRATVLVKEVSSGTSPGQTLINLAPSTRLPPHGAQATCPVCWSPAGQAECHLWSPKKHTELRNVWVAHNIAHFGKISSV